MFNRAETSRIRQDFWTTFGKYMSPVPSAEGAKMNWINYRTGVRNIHFRMETLPDCGTISISIEDNDPDLRSLHFEQFLEFKEILHGILEEKWDWQPNAIINNRSIARIYKELAGASVTNKDHWPELISFFKPRIIALDAFWENAKYSFDHPGSTFT